MKGALYVLLNKSIGTHILIKYNTHVNNAPQRHMLCNVRFSSVKRSCY